MSRISIFFMVVLLLFNAMPVSFAQQSSVQAQAEVEALSDMSGMSKTMWFLLGGVGEYCRLPPRLCRRSCVRSTIGSS